MENDEDKRRRSSIAEGIRSWIIPIATVFGVFGAVVSGQIMSNQTSVLTADHVQQIQLDIKEIRTSLNGLPQTVLNLQNQMRDEQTTNGVQNAQINTLATTLAETKIRVDNLERASNTKLR